MDSQDKDKDIRVYDKTDFKDGNTPSKKERDRWKNTSFIASFDFAVTGIWTALKQERNMRKHFFSTFLAIFCGLIFQISKTDWLFLLLSCFLVITAELFNSSIENVVDLAADYQFHMRAKLSKDMAAGAVLVISCFALVVGCFIFLPKIWAFIFG